MTRKLFLYDCKLGDFLTSNPQGHLTTHPDFPRPHLCLLPSSSSLALPAKKDKIKQKSCWLPCSLPGWKRWRQDCLCHHPWKQIFRTVQRNPRHRFTCCCYFFHHQQCCAWVACWVSYPPRGCSPGSSRPSQSRPSFLTWHPSQPSSGPCLQPHGSGK